MIQYVCDICNKSKCSSNEGDELYLMTAMVKGKANIWHDAHICLNCIRAAIKSLPGPEKKSAEEIIAEHLQTKYMHETDGGD